MQIINSLKAVALSFAIQRANYWRVHKWLRNQKFRIQRLYFGVYSESLREGEASQVILGLTLASLWQVLMALLCASLLQASNVWFQPDVVGWPIPDEGTYATFLGTVASIAGVFIGLYYTAITAIAASVYASLPSGIRSLLTEEKSGGVYIRFLAFLACLCTFLLAFRLVGFQPIVQAIPLIAVLSCVGVVAFVVLGQRAFTFFDPLEFSQRIAQQVQENIDRVVQGGHQWLEPAFQQNARQRTHPVVRAAIAMGEFCKSRSALNEQPYVVFCKWVTRILLIYKTKKRQIPSGSQWFVRRNQFGAFYQANETVVMLATRTGSLPEPAQIVDFNWLDDQLESLLIEAISFYIKAEDAGPVGEIGDLLVLLVDRACSIGETEEALTLIQKLASKIEEKFRDGEVETDRAKKQRFRLLLAEVVGRLLIQTVLSVRKFCIGIDTSKVAQSLHSISIKKSYKFYEHGGPRLVNMRLEKLNAQLMLECAVEGSIKTPAWFIQEQIDNAFAEETGRNIETLFTRLPVLSKNLFRIFSNPDFEFSNSSILRSETEMLSKMDSHFETILSVHQRLSENRKIKGLAWKEIDGEQIRVSLRDLSLENSVNCAASISKLLKLERPTDLPDYPGLFLHQTGETVIDALINNDSVNFEKLFGAYFEGCLAMTSQSTIVAVANGIDQFQVKNALVPLAELLNVSGYAIFIDDARMNSKISLKVYGCWTALFESERGEYWKKFLKAVWAVVEDQTSPAQRSQVRFNWGLTISRAVAAILQLADSYPYGHNLKVQHPSPLVRAAAEDMSNGMLNYTGIELFRAAFLFDAIGVPPGETWLDLVEDMKKNSKDHQGGNRD